MKRTIVYFLSLGYVGFWLFILYHSFYYVSFKVFVFEWAIFPMYIMGLSLFFTNKPHKKGIKSLSTFALLMLHSFFTLLYLIFTVFYFPLLLEKETLKQKIGSAKSKIMEYSKEAKDIGDSDEVYEYSQIYKEYFSELKGEQFLSSKEKMKKDLFLYDDNEKEKIQSIADMINVVNTKSLSEEELLQIIREYVYEEYFYAAQLFLSQYVAIYGSSRKIEKLATNIKEKIDSHLSSYELERKFYFQRKIRYIYNLLFLDKTHYNELLSAYYQIKALNNMYPENDQLQWLLQLWKKRAKDIIVFSGEIRIALSRHPNKSPIVFEEKRENNIKRLWMAKDSIYINNAAYFSDLQLLLFDEKGNIIFQMKTPYAKLSNGKIVLQTVERKAVQVKYAPEIIQGEKRNIREIPTTVIPREISYLYSNYRILLGENIVNIIQSIPIWKKYSLPIRILYNRIVYDIMRILFFVIVGYLIVYMQLEFYKRELPVYITYMCCSIFASSGLILRGITKYTILVYDLSFFSFIKVLAVLGLTLFIILASIMGLMEHLIKRRL